MPAFSIEINVDDQGQITVDVESGGDETQEGQAAPAAGAQGMQAAAPTDDEGEDQGQSAQDIDDALQIAKQLYLQQSGGEQDDSDDPANGSEPLTGDAAKSAWSQLAQKKDQTIAKRGMQSGKM